MTQEEWRDIKGYESHYQVSNLGRVRSLKKESHRILKPALTHGGYLQVAFWKDGVARNKKVHRLVAEAFIENSCNYPEVNHKDENKQNNHSNNLEWCTKKYNCNYGTKNERSALAQRNHPAKSKPVKAVSLLDGSEVIFASMSEAKRLGFNVGHISACCKGKRNKHGECLWSYVLTELKEGAINESN